MIGDLKLYISHPFNISDYKKGISPYMAAIRDARDITGRNIESGEIVDGNKLGCWSGALAYMALIDHIGKYFSLKNEMIKNERNSFIKALKTFASLNERDSFCLYALRCSFMHEFSLINIPKNNADRDLLMHRFIVTRGGDSLVTYPKSIWDGDIENEESKTIVDLGILGNIVEQMHMKIVDSIRKNEIEFIGDMVFLSIPAIKK